MAKFKLSLNDISDNLIENYKRKGYFGVNCTIMKTSSVDSFEGIIETENDTPFQFNESPENFVKTKYGEIQRRIVSVDAPYYNFDIRFAEATNWIDESIDVLSMTPIEVKSDDCGIREKYLVIYREIIEV